MFNWCCRVTMLVMKEEEKKTRVRIYFDRNLFCAVKPAFQVSFSASSEPLKKYFSAPPHKQKRHTQQLSNIKHEALFAKAITKQEQILCLMPWRLHSARGREGDVLRKRSEQLPAWFSPGESQQRAVNKLLWPGRPASFPSLRNLPATGQGAGGP